MITKEHLKELIQQGATVYHINNSVIEIKLDNCCDFKGDYIWKPLKNNPHVKWVCYHFKEVFETKEEAEFALKYQNITRTETLNLPTWEEFKNFTEKYQDVVFYNKDVEYTLTNFYKVCDNIHLIMIVSKKNGILYNEFKKPLEKKWYLDACEICKKLFLGEEIDE